MSHSFLFNQQSLLFRLVMASSSSRSERLLRDTLRRDQLERQSSPPPFHKRRHSHATTTPPPSHTKHLKRASLPASSPFALEDYIPLSMSPHQIALRARLDRVLRTTERISINQEEESRGRDLASLLFVLFYSTTN